MEESDIENPSFWPVWTQMQKRLFQVGSSGADNPSAQMCSAVPELVSMNDGLSFEHALSY
jgi:hypothetical protein